MTRYRAPFAAGGSSAIDPAIASRLLETALSLGGEYADLFFEYRAGGSLSYEEGILKSANRGVNLGLGVRVQKGDATGYAYTESLELDDMKQAARTAAQIASGGARAPAELAPRLSMPKRYELEG